MVEIPEGRLRFTFQDDWQAIKFDETAWYSGTMKRRIKAMDILATQGQTHWWIEIKDCVGFEPDNLPRLNPAEPSEVSGVRAWVKGQGLDRAVSVTRAKPFLVDEIAEKLEGTLVSLMAAQRAGASQPDVQPLQPFAEVAQQPTNWRVVLVLAWNPRDFRRLAMRLNDKLRQRLAAYDVECYVLNEGESAPQQPWTVTRIPS